MTPRPLNTPLFPYTTLFRSNQLAHFDHARRGTNLAEKFSVRAAHLFPFGNVGDVNARAHDILQCRTGLRERGFDVADGLDGLRAGVAYAHNSSVGPRRRGSRNRDGVADAHRARVTDNRLPGRSAGNVLPVHV